VPTFDPTEVRRLANDATTVSITTRASDDAAALGFTNEDIRETLRELDCKRVRFHKSMESGNRPGSMFDVYHISSEEHTIYLKFTIGTRRYPSRDRCIVVTSFKQK
jgi:hypothetical protein